MRASWQPCCPAEAAVLRLRGQPRCSPKTPRRMSLISPTVASFPVASRIGGIRLRPDEAARSTSASAAATSCRSRRARTRADGIHLVGFGLGIQPEGFHPAGGPPCGSGSLPPPLRPPIPDPAGRRRRLPGCGPGRTRSRSRPAAPPSWSTRSIQERASASISSVSASIANEPPSGSTVGGDPALEGDHLLGSQRQFGGLRGRQPEGFVEGVRVERLGAAEDGGQSLQGGPDHVHLGLPGGERRTRGLGVEAKHPRPRTSGTEAFPKQPGPQPTGSPELGHLLEEIPVGVEEEGHARTPPHPPVPRAAPSPRHRRDRWRA